MVAGKGDEIFLREKNGGEECGVSMIVSVCECTCMCYGIERER